MRKILFLFLVIFTLCLIKLDRFFLKKNHGFCVHFIQGTLAHNDAWKTPDNLPEDVISQNFYYLSKGSQTYAFESADKNYVIKFYKFPSHMRKISYLKHPFAYHFDPKRIKIKEHNEKRFALSYNSYWMASQELAKETGVIYAHLNPTHHLNKKIILHDRLGARYELPLDPLGFFIQKKATLLFTALKEAIADKNIVLGKQVIDSTLEVIVSRCEKGVSDLDNMIHSNFGWLDSRAIHIDVGRFVRDETVKTPEACKKEVLRITQELSDLLAQSCPELHAYFQSRVLNPQNSAENFEERDACHPSKSCLY